MNEVKEGVRVKRLEWHEIGTGLQIFHARAILRNNYRILGQKADKWEVLLEGDRPFEVCKTLEAAKAAAQSDYESRIRSCLLDKPEAVKGDAAGEGWTGKKCPHCNGHGIRADIDGEERRCTDCAGTGDEYGCKFIGPEGFFHDQFEKPVETDTPLQSAAREAGWALSTLVDEIKFEKRQQVVNIINRLSAAFYALYAPADTDAAQSEADRLRRELEEARRALDPFADVSGEGDEDFKDDTPVTVKFGRTLDLTLTLADFRRAGATLRAGEEGK
ncbi:hypothetical protein [Sinorhizobium meliloti]|uniref:hypothetical protein n=1 Tax=Rhizobium meliloti TaxID=382 RepID=UPI000FD9B25F|nr:hypothetical protein [Sinorhizobium meliloti]RVH21477.1 hypothetical protein CN216_00460 [Sinorhizobium meliloti]RVH21538.1 hypothetical protein CN216_00780 [Sinorhizobium meliloti]